MARFALIPACPGRYLQCGIVFAMFGLATAGGAHAAESDRLKIGAGAAVIPRFEGSDEYRVRPVPLIDFQKGRFFARTGDGIGLNIVQTSRFTMGAGVNWMKGYRDSDVPDGIGKLSDALGGRLFVSTRVAGAVATLSATQAITKSERGLVANARVSYPYTLTERLKLIPSVSVNWANAKYMDSYFGVNAGQSAASGLAQYRPSAGFKDVSLRLAVNYELTKDWSVSGAVGASRLLGDAADSPLVERKSQLQAMAGVAYTF